jgi:polyhydroxyalkanoate synthesis regulator phasin
MLTRFSTKSLAILGGLFLATGALFAQDNAPLIDLLVKKGIVNDQEAEELKAELVKSYVANTSAGKLNMSSALSEFKISGDVRLRHQIESKSNETSDTVSNERTRERFRFRLNGDALLQKGWGAGFALETASAADSGNQTFENGADDYSIYLARAYISYKPNLNWSFFGGKFKNPLYTTDMVWDADINPQGFNENYTAFLGGKSGKDTLEVRVMQSIMDDNNESAFGPSGRDAWLFAQQLVYTGYFGKNNLNSFIIAPGFSAYSDSVLSGLTNETPFNGSTRYYKVLHFPGEVNFANIAGEGSSFKTYWDYAYNTEANDRVHKAYGIASQFSSDPTAWLVGVGYAQGAGKMQGDWSLKLDYRTLGIGSVDPNTSDSDFGFGNLNQRGFKFAGSYNLTDFANLNISYFYTTDKQGSLNNAVAALDRSQILQIDLVVKF